MMAAHVFDEAQLSAGLEHAPDFLKSDDRPFDTAEDQRRHNCIEGVIGEGEMLDVGGGQSDVGVRSRVGLHDGSLIKLSRHHACIGWVMIEIGPPARTHLQHKTVHVA